jgi:cytosine/adenosine deaminase-related metal-dependent hydrolase
MTLQTSRRAFLAAASLMAAAGPGSETGSPLSPALPQAQPNRILLKGGCVVSLDSRAGNFEVADVLIEGARILEVRPNITANAMTIDATNTIVMPGFVDTHRHMWEGPLRNILPDGLLSDYTRDITGAARSVYRPQDAKIGNLVSALGAINAGVTTLLDWSHIGNSPQHSDAAIEGLRESRVRAVYAYGGGTGGAQNQFPADIRRLRKQHFSSPDQLLTLAMATGANANDWRIAREVGAPITLHLVGANALASMKNMIGPDVTYIHCNNLAESDWQMIASSGGHVSIACPIEMEMGHGVPPIQEALDHGIRPSLSTDVETQMPGEFFTQMRSVFTLQRMLALQRQRAGDPKPPRLLTTREVVEFATIEGAKDNALDSKVGTLTPGKEADIIMLRVDQINVMPLNNVYGAVVLAMDTSNVDTVLIRGNIVKRQGRLVGVDLDRIRKEVQQSRDYIVEKAGWPKTVFGGYLPGH